MLGRDNRWSPQSVDLSLHLSHKPGSSRVGPPSQKYIASSAGCDKLRNCWIKIQIIFEDILSTAKEYDGTF